MEKLLASLHPFERKVLPLLAENITVGELVEKSGLKDVEVMRALQWLENKGALKTKVSVEEVISLDINGKRYVKECLPEERFLKSIGNGSTLEKIKNEAHLGQDEVHACIGMLKRIGAISLGKEINILPRGKAIIKEGFSANLFLKTLPRNLSSLSDNEVRVYEELKRRKQVITTRLLKTRSVKLTELGKSLSKQKSSTEYIDQLTSQHLRDGSWQGKTFRRYDVSINVPFISPGRVHFVKEALQYVKQIWVEMGFSEMTGPFVQTSFWNFDALFMAQDHPGRDMQDTFFIAEPRFGKLPSGKVVEQVKKTHESGWNTGSIGWRYKWDANEAKRNVLRTHTTALSVRTLSKLKEKELPIKVFSVSKVFRNETLDWSHLFEFHQAEGIVVDRNVNFCDLLGYLKEFFKKMGYSKVRFRPAYFPYTEPSVEVEVYHPKRHKWIELGGAGIFRPEVVEPLLGKGITVLAWGLGLERIITDYYGISDLRDIYRNDISQLKKIRAWVH